MCEHRKIFKVCLPFYNIMHERVKQKKGCNIYFIICHQHQARPGKIKPKKTQQILVKTQVFFVKAEIQHI